MQFTPQKKQGFYANFAQLLRAGLGMLRSLELLASHHPRGPARKTVDTLSLAIRSGSSLDEALALAAHCGISDLERQLLVAGERSGRLPETMDDLVALFDQSRRVRNQVIAGLAYPALLIHLAATLPQLPPLITGQSTAIEALSRVALFLVPLYLFLAILSLAYAALAKAAASSAAAESVLRRIPLFGKARHVASLARFTKVFALSLRSGLLVSDSLRNAAAASRSGRIISALPAATSTISHGKTLAEALAPVPGLDTELLASVALAEQAGSLDEELSRWGLLYRERADILALSIARWIPRALYLVALVYVITSIFSLFHSYLSTITEAFSL
jgi:type II secretory pathway component PulF